MLVIVCSGGAILQALQLAILDRLYAIDGIRLSLMYGTYVACHCPILVMVFRVFLLLLLFNTYSCIPNANSMFTIPRLSLFLSISI